MELLPVESILKQWFMKSVLMVVLLTIAQPRRSERNAPSENPRQKEHQFADKNNFLSNDQQQANQQRQDQGQVEFKSQEEGQQE